MEFLAVVGLIYGIVLGIVVIITWFLDIYKRNKGEMVKIWTSI